MPPKGRCPLVEIPFYAILLVKHDIMLIISQWDNGMFRASGRNVLRYLTGYTWRNVSQGDYFKLQDHLYLKERIVRYFCKKNIFFTKGINLKLDFSKIQII